MPEDPDDLVFNFPFEGSKVPTAVFHGMGDACIFPGMRSLDKMIAAGTGGYVECIDVGIPSVGEVFTNFETMAEKTCAKLKANKNFAGSFNVVGLS